MSAAVRFRAAVELDARIARAEAAYARIVEQIDGVELGAMPAPNDLHGRLDRLEAVVDVVEQWRDDQ